ncbi:MAG: fatty acid desaturase, partial [Planctomycetes bacterium]|nr:fatty acid desaturase [Planctomycetota bacterium]
MTAIPPGHAVDWYRVPLPPGLLDQLNRRSDLLGSAQTLGYLAICAATGAYAVWAAAGAHGGHLAAALILHGTVCAFMINAVHELVHGTVFRTRWLNTAFAHLFAFIGWINHRGFWASHAEHHLHTMHFPYDQENVFPIRYRLADFLRAATCDPRGMYWNLRHHVRVASGRLDGDWERHLLAGQPRHREVVAWSRWLLAGHAAVAVASIATGWWIVPIVVSLTPVYCRGLFWLLNNAQHVGLMESAPDFRLNCRTIVVNPVFRFLYWHMNWHIEHHMYAAVPCYRLHALHRAIRPQLPYCPRGLVETWYTIIGIMWRQQREPGWTFRQELPGETRTAAAADPATATAPTPAAAAPERRRVWR